MIPAPIFRRSAEQENSIRSTWLNLVEAEVSDSDQLRTNFGGDEAAREQRN